LALYNKCVSRSYCTTNWRYKDHDASYAIRSLIFQWLIFIFDINAMMDGSEKAQKGVQPLSEGKCPECRPSEVKKLGLSSEDR